MSEHQISVPINFFLYQLPQKVPQIKIGDYVFTLMMATPSFLILLDPVTNFKYQYFLIPKDYAPEKTPFWIPSCRKLCGKPSLRRWHFTCMFSCRIRKCLNHPIWREEKNTSGMPRGLYRVSTFFTFRNDWRRGARWKNWVAKRVMSLLEFFFN